MVAKLRAEFPARRVLRIAHGGRVLWIKCAAKPHWRSRVGFRLLGALAFLTRREILKPRTNPGGIAGLRNEEQILRSLHERGVRVPRVLASARDGSWLALSDLGESLGRCLAAQPQIARRRHLLLAAARELAQLHAAGQVHGAPLPRNILVDEVAGNLRIGFLDFEDHTSARMQFARAAARDIALFLWGAVRWSRADSTLLQDLLATWRASAPAAAGAELDLLARLAVRLRAPLKPLLPILGGDLRRASLTLDAIAPSMK